MNIGDLVRRKTVPPWRKKTHPQRELGIVVSIQAGWPNPDHECVAVCSLESGQTYDIARSLMEVVSESR